MEVILQLSQDCNDLLALFILLAAGLTHPLLLASNS